MPQKVNSRTIQSKQLRKLVLCQWSIIYTVQYNVRDLSNEATRLKWTQMLNINSNTSQVVFSFTMT